MERKYSSAEIFEFQANAKQFRDWNACEEDIDFVAHLKKVALIAMNEILSEKQKNISLCTF